MRKFHLGIQYNSSFISLVFTENPKAGPQKVIFRLIEKESQDFELLDNVAIDRIEREIIRTEREFHGKVSRLCFCVPSDKVKKITGISQRILHPKHSRAVSLLDLRKSIEQARLLHVDWSSRCLHSFPLEFKLDDKAYKKPPVGVYGRKLQIKVAFYVCSQDYILNVENFFQRLGRNYSSLVLSSLGAAASLREQGLQKGNFASLDFGRSKLELACFRNFILVDIATFSLGGHSIDEEVSRGLNIPVKLCEDIKISYGSLLEEDLQDSRAVTVKRVLAYRQLSRGSFNSILSRSYIKALREVKIYLDSRNLSDAIDFIVPLGGAVKIRGFNEIAESVLSLPFKKIHSYIWGLLKDELHFLDSFGALRFSSSKFNAENTLRFPTTFLRRIKNLLEEYF